MEKILQILSVFALLVVAVTYFTRGRRPLYRAYVFSGQRKGLFLPGQRKLPEGSSGAAGALGAAGISGAAGESREPAQPVQDPENQLLLRRNVTERRLLEMVDEGTGDVVASLQLAVAIDVILFDPEKRYIYCGSWEGRLFIIRQLSREEYRLLQTIEIPEGCDGLALDPGDKTVYVQCGDYYYVYTTA